MRRGHGAVSKRGRDETPRALPAARGRSRYGVDGVTGPIVGAKRDGGTLLPPAEEPAIGALPAAVAAASARDAVGAAVAAIESEGDEIEYDESEAPARRTRGALVEAAATARGAALRTRFKGEGREGLLSAAPVVAPKVIVVGAGFAGIAAARTLTDLGYQVQVLEGRNRIGGRVHSLMTPSITSGGGEKVRARRPRPRSGRALLRAHRPRAASRRAAVYMHPARLPLARRAPRSAYGAAAERGARGARPRPPPPLPAGRARSNSGRPS